MVTNQGGTRGRETTKEYNDVPFSPPNSSLRSLATRGANALTRLMISQLCRNSTATVGKSSTDPEGRAAGRLPLNPALNPRRALRAIPGRRGKRVPCTSNRACASPGSTPRRCKATRATAVTRGPHSRQLISPHISNLAAVAFHMVKRNITNTRQVSQQAPTRLDQGLVRTRLGFTQNQVHGMKRVTIHPDRSVRGMRGGLRVV